jgi:hypothetical protein
MACLEHLLQPPVLVSGSHRLVIVLLALTAHKQRAKFLLSQLPLLYGVSYLKPFKLSIWTGKTTFLALILNMTPMLE